MTEAEWLACDDPKAILDGLTEAASDRKLRLFGCACARWVWHSVPDEFRAAIEVAEQFADGAATNKQLGAAKAASGATLSSSARPVQDYRVCGIAWSVTRNAATAARYPCWVFTDAEDRQRQTAFLRDIFGNPFRPVAFDPSWRSADAVALAHSIYEDRVFDRLPLLADALMDAGCDDEQVMGHCRSEGPHVRGCWVVDLVLGKE